MARNHQPERGVPRYVSEPVRAQRRWADGFYTGEQDRDEEIRRQAERPHGWGNFEANFDVASSEPHRVDLPHGHGGHRGKGPKGYARSDERTREIICDQLMDDPRIDATDVDVQVQKGEIRITGTVERRQTKHLIEELIEQCTGNGNIVNLLRVERNS